MSSQNTKRNSLLTKKKRFSENGIMKTSGRLNAEKGGRK